MTRREKLLARASTYGLNEKTIAEMKPQEAGEKKVGGLLSRLTEAKNLEMEQEYARYMERASKEDFSDLQKHKMVYNSGKDLYSRPILVIVGSLVPAKTVDLDRLLLFFIWTLDPFVSQDYVLIYVHTHFSSENMPKFNWLRKCYSIFSRKYKKNLKELFIVQPTNLVKTTMKFFKPFISNKFWRKLHYINDIKALYQFMSPQQVQLPIELNASSIDTKSEKPTKGEIFGEHLQIVMEHPMNINESMPLIVSNAIRYLTINGPKTEGVFRLCGKLQRLEDIKAAYDRGEAVDFSGESDVHVIAGLLKSYIRELPDPLLCFHVYRQWIDSYTSSDITGTKARMKELLKKLPKTNRVILNALMGLCVKIAARSKENKMTAQNLAICWAPNILKAQEENFAVALMDAGTVNSIVSLFISNYTYFF